MPMVLPDTYQKSNRPLYFRLASVTSYLVALVILCAAPVTRGDADALDPATRFTVAYESLTTADFLVKKDMPLEAAELYGEALTRLLRIAGDEPDWQPEVVAYRIAYCRQALAALAATPETETSPAPAVPPAETPPLPVPDTVTVPEPVAMPPISTGIPLGRNLKQAAALERAGNVQGALFIYMALRDDYPREAAVLKGACRCALRLGMEENTRALARQMAALPAQDATLSLLLGLVHCREGRFTAALPLLRQSLQDDPGCAEAYVALGVVLAATNQAEDAMQAWKRALSVNPRLGDAYYNMARLALWQKPADLDTVAVHYRQARRYGVPPDIELDRLLQD